MLKFFKKNQNKDIQTDTNKASLKDRLSKSKRRLGHGLSSILIGKKQVDDELLEELEILMISADIGIQTTDKIIESVRKKASRKELKDGDSLYQLIKIELEALFYMRSVTLSCIVVVIAIFSVTCSIKGFGNLLCIRSNMNLAVSNLYIDFTLAV